MQLYVRAAAALALTLTLMLSAQASVIAGPLIEPTDCSIENQTPSLQLGAEAQYVVHLFGGSGNYSISFAYGDGWIDTASLSGMQTTFAHWFQSRGTFTQTAHVSSTGSSATCTSQTTVW